MTFSYQARDSAGNIVTGIQDAINEDNAVTSLMSRGLMVLSLQQKAAASRQRKKAWTVKETDLVLFHAPARDHDRGRYFARSGADRALRAMRSEAAKESPPRYQRRDHSRPGWRNLSRVDRQTSARLQSSFRQHGESGRGRRFACGDSRPAGRLPRSQRPLAQEGQIGHDLPGHRHLHRVPDHHFPDRSSRADLRRNLQGFRRQAARRRRNS